MKRVTYKKIEFWVTWGAIVGVVLMNIGVALMYLFHNPKMITGHIIMGIGMIIVGIWLILAIVLPRMKVER